jgi:hypothetical protein
LWKTCLLLFWIVVLNFRNFTKLVWSNLNQIAKVIKELEKQKKKKKKRKENKKRTPGNGLAQPMKGARGPGSPLPKWYPISLSPSDDRDPPVSRLPPLVRNPRRSLTRAAVTFPFQFELMPARFVALPCAYKSPTPPLQFPPLSPLYYAARLAKSLAGAPHTRRRDFSDSDPPEASRRLFSVPNLFTWSRASPDAIVWAKSAEGQAIRRAAEALRSGDRSSHPSSPLQEEHDHNSHAFDITASRRISSTSPSPPGSSATSPPSDSRAGARRRRPKP